MRRRRDVIVAIFSTQHNTNTAETNVDGRPCTYISDVFDSL
jgi:hypothetical protein